MNKPTSGDFEFLRQQQLAHQAALDKVKFNKADQPIPKFEQPQDKSTAINERMRSSMMEAQPTGSGLSTETLKGLEKFAEEAAKQDKIDPLKEIEDNDDYIYDDYGTKIRNLHNNRKRRKAIEERCSEMDIADLLSNQFVTQTVPIVPSKFVVTYKSLTGHEELLIKSLMAKEASFSNQISSWYIIGKYSMLRLAAGLVKLNGRTLQDINGVDGKPDEKLLLQKFQYIANFSNDILADLDVNYIWFSERVKELSVADNILNF